MSLLPTTERCGRCGEVYFAGNQQLHVCDERWNPTSTELPQSWQQVTPTLLETEACYSLGISNLEVVSKQIHALRLTAAGICSNLLANSQLSTGADVTEALAQTDASFANLQRDLLDYISVVRRVQKQLQNSLKK